MYQENVKFNFNSPEAKKVKRVLDYLLQAFPEKTPELGRYNVISLYTLVSQLLERYVVQKRHNELANWFIEFERYRKEEDKKPEDECDQEIAVYHERIQHSTDSVDSIDWRHQFLIRTLFEAIPNIEQKDDQRLFTHEQRLAIYRRDGGKCQLKIKCNGEKCNWEKWEADHKIPWSKGGKTIVSNGQVACLACNSAKGDNQVEPTS
jgi:hypothetical protein